MDHIQDWLKDKERVSWDYSPEGSEYGIIVVPPTEMVPEAHYSLVHFQEKMDDLVAVWHEDKWKLMPRESWQTRVDRFEVYKISHVEALMIAFEASNNLRYLH